MKVLLAHDHKFRFNGEYFSTGGLSDEVLSRYVSIFGKLAVVARVVPVGNDDKQLSKIKNTCVTIFDINSHDTNLHELISDSDCIIARMPSVTALKAIWIAKKYKKPYMIELVGCPWDSLWNHSFKGKVVAPMMWAATKKAVKNAPYILYVTNEFLQRRYPSKGESINCSDVVLQTLDHFILERRLNKIKKMSEKSPVILGTIAAVNVRYKAQQYIIQAIARLNEQGCHFKYYMVGAGDNHYLKSVAEECGVVKDVNFLGSLPHEKIFQYLDHVDIYIQPSKQEGLPRAVIEAMSRGCPCMGSNVGGIPELLNKQFLFHSNAVDEICGLLQRADKQMMIKEAVRNFEKAKEYDENLLAERRNSFYKEFAKKVKKKND